VKNSLTFPRKAEPAETVEPFTAQNRRASLFSATVLWEQLTVNARSAPRFAGEYRRMLLRRFEHGIFYQMHSQRIVVVAVLSLRQDLGAILKRLGLQDFGPAPPTPLRETVARRGQRERAGLLGR
jgi:hypothetical protein